MLAYKYNKILFFKNQNRGTTDSISCIFVKYICIYIYIFKFIYLGVFSFWVCFPFVFPIYLFQEVSMITGMKYSGCTLTSPQQNSCGSF